MFENYKQSPFMKLLEKYNSVSIHHPAGIYLLKVNNRNTRTRCEICSKLTIKTGVFIVNFEHISHLVLVFLLLTLNMQLPAGQRNLHILATEMYKVSKDLSPPLMRDIFKLRSEQTYNLTEACSEPCQTSKM